MKVEDVYLYNAGKRSYEAVRSQRVKETRSNFQEKKLTNFPKY